MASTDYMLYERTHLRIRLNSKKGVDRKSKITGPQAQSGFRMLAETAGVDDPAAARLNSNKYKNMMSGPIYITRGAALLRRRLALSSYADRCAR